MTQDPNGRIIRLAFGALALLSVIAGFALYLFAGRLGLSEDTARLLATAFIVAGVLDAGVLYYWDRLFGPRP